jgi:hypothetical protein
MKRKRMKISKDRGKRVAECTRYIVKELMGDLDEDSVPQVVKILVTTFERQHLLGKVIPILTSLHNEINSGKMDASHIAAAIRDLTKSEAQHA